MNNINTTMAVFKFKTNDVRTIVKDGEPWFVAADVCSALGYKNVSQTVGDNLDDDEKGISTGYTLGGDQKLTIINESGLYALVLRSRKPEARKFAKWVTSEVLPSIRKTGKFDVRDNSGPLTIQMRESIKSLVIDRAKTLPLDKQASAIIKAWSALKSHFGVSYKEIPSDKYAEAVSLIARLQVAWESPEPDTRHRRQLIVVDERGTSVTDVTGYNLIKSEQTRSLRRDLATMAKAMVEMQRRIGVCFGEANPNCLDAPLKVL